MLLLTLAARKGMARVYSMRVMVIMGIEKSRLGCRFQRHGPLHIVIAGPDGTYLFERQHWNLVEVQLIHLHPEGMSRVHPGEPGWVAPGLQAGPGAKCSQLSRHIR